jgi:hypothetical protein
MSILAIILTVVAVLIVTVLVIAAAKPDAFGISRSTTMRAPADRIFPLINDLRAHESWSSFDKPDPAVEKVHSGARVGTGAVYEWNGGGQAGAGRLAITESVAPSRIASPRSAPSTINMQLDMLKPIKAGNQVMFTLQPQGNDSTEVTWTMQGRRPFIVKLMHVFFDMDRMVGGEFETSLGKLKTLVER